MAGQLTYIGDKLYSNGDRIAVSQGDEDISPFTMKNKLINGGFDVWQRGTSWDGDTVTYTADRWKHISQSAGTSYVAKIGSNEIRMQKYGASSYCFIRQQIESVAYLSGQTVTFSVKLKSVAGPTNVRLAISGRAGKDSSNLNNPDFNANLDIPITEEYVRYTLTTTLPEYDNDEYSFGTVIDIRDGVTGGTTADIHIKEAQLELGSTATPFEQRPIGMELSLCQRYYQVFNVSGSTNLIMDGYYLTNSYLIWRSIRPVQMRTNPTMSGSFAGTNVQGMAHYISNADMLGVFARTIASGRAYFNYYDSTSDAEL